MNSHLFLPLRLKRSQQCPRCNMHYKKMLKQCPHCSQLPDGPALDALIEQHQRHLRGAHQLGLTFWGIAAVLAMLLALVILT